MSCSFFNNFFSFSDATDTPVEVEIHTAQMPLRNSNRLSRQLSGPTRG